MDDPTTAARFLLGAAMLAGAVAHDLRTRRVPNTWWLPFLGMALVLAIGDWLWAPDLAALAIRYGVAAAVAGVCYGLWRFGMFGGADAKGLMLLALLAPWPPERDGALQPALDALSNGAALMLLVPVAFLAWNLVRGRLSFPAAFLGTTMDLEAARTRHVWPMQVVQPDGSLRWRYWQRLAGELDLEYAALGRAGVAKVWVTPKVPFMLLVLLGWALAWRWGNVLFACAAALAGP